MLACILTPSCCSGVSMHANMHGKSGSAADLVCGQVSLVSLFFGGKCILVKVHPYPYIYMTGFCTFLESAFSVTFDS